MSTCPPSVWATSDPGSGFSGPGPPFTTEEKGQRTGGARTQEERSVAGFRRPNHHHHHHHLGKSARPRCDPRQKEINPSTMYGEIKRIKYKIEVKTKRKRRKKKKEDKEFKKILIDSVLVFHVKRRTPRSAATRLPRAGDFVLASATNIDQG